MTESIHVRFTISKDVFFFYWDTERGKWRKWWIRHNRWHRRARPARERRH